MAFPTSLDSFTSAVDGITIVDATDRNNVQNSIIAIEKNALPVFNVRTYGGAIGNGVTDDSGAIQTCITAAQAAPGGIVFIPAGVYYLAAGLTINGAVTLQGVGWGPSGTFPSPGANGTWFYVSSTAVTALTITNGGGNGSTVRGIGFAFAQPVPGSGWAPNAHQYAINCKGTDVTLENINLYNATNGILCANGGTGSVGRVVMRHIWGQPLTTGIFIDDALDVMRVEDVHFWPFWSQDANVYNWMWANATGLFSGRNDNPHYSSIFTLGYMHAMKFDHGPQGVTSKFRIVNADFDAAGQSGIYIASTGTGTTGWICNATGQGQNANTCPQIFYNAAPSSTVLYSNIQASTVLNNGMNLQNGVNVVTNVWVDNYNKAGGTTASSAAPVRVDGSAAMIGTGMTASNGNGSTTAFAIGTSTSIYLNAH